MTSSDQADHGEAPASPKRLFHRLPEVAALAGLAACLILLVLAVDWTQSRSPLYLFLLLVPAGTYCAYWGGGRLLRSEAVPHRVRSTGILVLGVALLGAFCWIVSSPLGFVFVSPRGAPPSVYFAGYGYTAERPPPDFGLPLPPAVVPGDGPAPVGPTVAPRLVDGLSCSATPQSLVPGPLHQVGAIRAIFGPQLEALSWTSDAPGEIYIHLPGDHCYLTYDKQGGV
jgi:hypothetical protein